MFSFTKNSKSRLRSQRTVEKVQPALAGNNSQKS